MRFALVIPLLLLGACNSAEKWENQQSELANEIDPPPPEESEPPTDYLNGAEPDANAVEAADNSIEAEDEAENAAAEAEGP